MEKQGGAFKSDTVGKHNDFDFTNLAPLVQSYQKLESCFVIITDFFKPGFIYVSPSATSITGYPVEKWLDGGIAFVSALHHPDEALFNKMVNGEILRFINSLSFQDKLKYRYCYNMRIKRSDNKYIKLLCQLMCLKTDEKGNPRVMLELFTNIFSPENDYTQKLTVSRYNKQTGYSEIAHYFVPEEANSGLSKRESEIKRLVSIGLTSKEIAKKIGLSKNTVDSYRKNIKNKLEKVDV